MNRQPLEPVRTRMGAPMLGWTDAFFQKVQESTDMPWKVSPQDAASAVLCTFTLRLGDRTARALQASMLPELQWLCQRCPAHAGETGGVFDRQEFMARIARHLAIAEPAAEALARAVLLALREQLPRHMVREVEDQLPDDLASLWRIDDISERLRERFGTGGVG